MAAAGSAPPPAPRNAAGAAAGAPPPAGASPMLLGDDDAGSGARPPRFGGAGGAAAKQRKVSNKLFAEPASVLRRLAAAGAVGALAGGGASGGGVTPAADAAALLAAGGVPGAPRGARSAMGGARARALLRALGAGHRLLASYRCREALDAFARLPPAHAETGWALTQVARCHFELVDYVEATRAYMAARAADPTRLAGFEHFSTVLWHARAEPALAGLAADAVAADRLSPAAWCAMGNCFSLQKEHETALRFFRRALQLDPSQPYPYTLCGHEYFANEDFEQASSAASLSCPSVQKTSWKPINQRTTH
jgi:anaphase-promoting complex subunit 3